MSAPRLLFVVPDARFFVTHRMPLALAAKARGYDVHVATPEGDAVAQIVAAGLPWHRARFGPMRRKLWSDLESLIDLLALYRKLRPALVHQVTFKAALYGTIAARLYGVRAVVNAITGLGEVFAARGIRDRIWRAVIFVLFRLFVRHRRMRVVLQNDDDREQMLAVVAPEQTVVIRGSGVDPSFYAPTPHAQDVPTVICASRIVYTKGIEEYIAAARLLRSRGVRARFLLAGDRDPGNGKTIPDRVFDEWLRDGAVEYLGMLDDARELYAISDVACLPSWGGEGVPKGLIEAASCELPIVATDVPGCRDIVRDGENGFLVPPREVEPLANALAKLIADPELRRRMGIRGRQLVIDEFSLQQVNDATLALYDELMSA